MTSRVHPPLSAGADGGAEPLPRSPGGIGLTARQAGEGAPQGFDPSCIWSEHLTDPQLRMIMESGADPRDGNGFGVELRGAAWATARSLAQRGLGWIEGGPGSDLPGMFFNNLEGVRITLEYDDDEGEG